MKYKIENLNMSYDQTQILHDISLNIEKGINYCIIGPNGSGKSTLINILTQHINKYDGKVLYLDLDISKYSKRDLSKSLGYVPQFESSAFDFNVYEFIMLGRSPHIGFFDKEEKEDIEIVEDAMKKVNVFHLKERNISTLSGGERQRAILARTIAQQPDVMILDEPSNHLDITNQIRLLSLIKKLNITTITAMHDLNMAVQFFQDVIVLKNGRIYDSGKMEKVLTTKMIKDVYELNSEITYKEKTKQYIISFNLED